MKKTVFTGTGVAIVTPMHADGSINYESFGKNIDFQIDNGINAIVVCGTTGESSTMTDEEHIECVRFCVKKADKRIPVIAGTGSNDTKYAVELSQEAQEAGADALLIVTPYYNKTSQRGLVRHFTEIADSVSIPLILYNIASRTGINISIDTYKALAEHGNIAATKEASGDISEIAKLFAACGDKLDVYSGNDDQTVPILALGGKGMISVTANILPKYMCDLTAFCLDYRYKEAAELQLRYLDLMNNLFIDVNPIPIKEAMNILGMNVGECRLPLIRMEQAKIDALKKALDAAGLNE